MEHHAEVLRGGVWHQRAPNWRDVAAVILVVTIIVLIGAGARQMVAPLVAAKQPEISLSPMALPGYALRTTIRMFAALVASLIFTFTYATLAAKSRRAEMVLIPLLDVLQSVPVLGYLSFTVVFFVSLFPGRAARGGTCCHLRDLHQPSLEHGLQLFSGTEDHSARSRRGKPQLPVLRLAAFLAA